MLSSTLTASVFGQQSILEKFFQFSRPENFQGLIFNSMKLALFVRKPSLASFHCIELSNDEILDIICVVYASGGLLMYICVHNMIF